MSARPIVVELTEPQARTLFAAAVRHEAELQADAEDNGTPTAVERAALDRAMRKLVRAAVAVGADLAPGEVRG